MPNDAPEVVVIGAGLGGLAAACDLAAAGRDVLLLERHSLPGGFATSFTRGRFEFETSLHELADTEAARYLRTILPDLEFLAVPEAYRVILTDRDTDFTAPFGIENFIEAAIRQVPEGEESLRRFMSLCEEIFDAFQYLGTVSPPSVRTLFSRYGNFLRTGAAVPDEVADALNMPRRMRDLVYPYWCYLGVPADEVSFPIFASLIYTYLKFGAVIPVTRSHGISTAMADYITRHGGRIRYNTEVVRLNTSGKRITGVELANGEVLRPGQVISNISHHRVFATLLGEQKTAPRIYGMLNARHPGMSFFVVYLGLDATMEQLGITEYSWFIAPDMETSALKRRTANRLDPEPMLAAICLNAADPDASPEGTTILSITIGTQPSAWADVAPEDYFGEKSRIAERVIAQFEKATGLDISGHIEEMDIAAPPTFARYTGSWDGRVYGYEPFPWDGIVPRVATKKRERVFRNLHFCGGNAYRAYGYGSSVMSGRSAADDVMKESAG